MAAGAAQTDRPSAAIWICASAMGGAIAGLAFPALFTASFVSAGLVGLAQGLLLRRWLDWWSWAVATLIVGGAALAVVRMVTTLAAHEIGTFHVSVLARLVGLNAAGGAFVGACQAFLLSSRYRRAGGWLAASSVAAALFWTTPSIALSFQEPERATPDFYERVMVGSFLAIAWGGLAAGTSLSMRRLKLRGPR
jgi:hypothetical protein